MALSDEDVEYGMVAVKRKHCPEWLFAMFKWVIPYQPFRWIFTTPVESENADAARNYKKLQQQLAKATAKLERIQEYIETRWQELNAEVASEEIAMNAYKCEMAKHARAELIAISCELEALLDAQAEGGKE